MKLDPNSREELPAVLRVATAMYAENQHCDARTALSLAHDLLDAYNEGQPDEPSAKMPTALDRRGWYVKDLEDTLATIAKAVGLGGEPDADALIAKVKELAKPMPTRKEMEERACTWFVDEYGIAAHARVRALIDYLLDGEAR